MIDRSFLYHFAVNPGELRVLDVSVRLSFYHFASTKVTYKERCSNLNDEITVNIINVSIYRESEI